MNAVLGGAYPIKVRSNGPPDPRRQTHSHDVSHFAQFYFAGADAIESNRIPLPFGGATASLDLRLFVQNDIQQ
jgi:hypothetical protein